MNKALEYAIANQSSMMKSLFHKVDVPDDANDIYQMICEKLLRSEPEVSVEEAAFYVVRVSQTVLADFYRKVNNAEMSIEDFTVEDDEGNTSTEVPYTFDQLHQYQIDMASDPMDLVEREQEMATVIAKIDLVRNPEHRGVLHLLISDHLPAKVVAERTGYSWGNVRKILLRFKEKI
jgi:DNA-directed RNA polymerase specialized sigma24 family protein